MNNRKKTLIIVGVSIFTIILLITVAGIVVDYIERDKYEKQWAKEQAVTEVYGTIEAKALGNLYEGNAKAEYIYYMITIPVFNRGTEEMECRYDSYLKIEGEEYDDVYQYFEEYDSTNFKDTSTKIIPPGQVGNLYEVVQVKNGVKKITLTYYSSSDEYYADGMGDTFDIEL